MNPGGAEGVRLLTSAERAYIYDIYSIYIYIIIFDLVLQFTIIAGILEAAASDCPFHHFTQCFPFMVLRDAHLATLSGLQSRFCYGCCTKPVPAHRVISALCCDPDVRMSSNSDTTARSTAACSEDWAQKLLRRPPVPISEITSTIIPLCA